MKSGICNSVLKKIFGYVEVRLTGDDISRFLNICSAKELDIWNISNNDGIYEMCISVESFFEIKEIAKKTKTRVRIQKKCGYPFFVKKNKNRKAYLIGICTFFAIIYVLSLFVWDIRFEGLYTYTEDILIEYLYENDIKHGIMKSDIDCTKIEKMLRNDFFDITWVSVSLEGTRLTINIQENYDYEVVAESEYEMSDIIATKDGIITSIITRSGTPLVKEGDVVAKGDILVTGNVVITDEYGTILKEEYKNADASIEAETVYNYSDVVRINEDNILYTGEKKKAYSIGVLNKSLYLLNGRVKYAHYDKVVEQHQLKLSDNFYLPIFFGETTYNEYEIVKVQLSEEDIKLRLDNNLQYFFDELLEKGVQIIENNVTIEKVGNQYVAEGKIVVIEDFGQNVSVENLYRASDENTERTE